MGFVANLYKSGGFVRLHYGVCHFIPSNRGRTPWKKDRWFKFETITEAVRWRERNFPKHPFRPCETCRPDAALQREG